MTTTSRPVIYDEAAITAGTITAADTNLTGVDWERVNRRNLGIESGFVLSLAGDTATLSVGYGVWRGYILEVTAGHGLSVPPVSTPTTYSLGVLYNPANYSTAAGPLSLAVFPKTGISVPSGGAFWTVYEIDRTASQVLTLSPVRSYRTERAGVLHIPSGSLLPPAAEYGQGQVAIVPTGMYRRDTVASTAAWVKVDDDTGWRTDGFAFSTGWANNGSRWRLRNGVATTQVEVKRTWPDAFAPGPKGQFYPPFPIAIVPIPVRATAFTPLAALMAEGGVGSWAAGAAIAAGSGEVQVRSAGAYQTFTTLCTFSGFATYIP